MSFNLDIEDDFITITDWLKTVTVDGTGVAKTLRRAISTKEAATSGGKYLTSDVAFHLDQSIHPARPAIGATITDSDGDWTILEVGNQTLGNRWRCVSRQLWIDPLLTVTITAPMITKGTTGAVQREWTTLAENVVAKIEINREEVEAGSGNRASFQFVTIYFAAPQELKTGYRIEASDGNRYEVDAWEGFSHIDALFLATGKQNL